MTVLFFWCLLLSALDGYLVFAYDTELDESFHQKWVYFLGGYMAFVYNLCFPWMAWFMDESLRPALISIYLLLNFCTLIRMMSVDYDGFVRSIWGNRWVQRNFEVRLKLEKLSAALFLAIST